MRKFLIVMAMFSMALATSWSASVGDDKEDKEKPKYSIKEVMKNAHKSGLLDKVAKGTASEEEKKELAELYLALHQNKPPKGSPDSWKEKTDALVKASKDVLAGKEGSGEALKKVANCMACHKEHKK